jgi:G patch domain-containing protein 1
MPRNDDEAEDYREIGTPLEVELEARGRRRLTTTAVGAKQAPVWKQAATDEQGRRRFHGAFTGGFSAGHFNTVGSKEGWTPASFVSSRGARAGAGGAAAPRGVEDFMDADELAEAEAARNAVGARAEYTATAALGGPAGEHLLDGPLPAELVVAVTDSIGARLLRQMGWRAGRGVARRTADEDEPPASAASAPRVLAALAALQQGEEAVLAGEDAEAHEQASPGPLAEEGAQAARARARRRRRWGTLAGALAADVEVRLPPRKQDVFGLGFDPYSGAEEFRRPVHLHEQPPAKRSRGAAFGVGIFEAPDDDVYGDVRALGRHTQLPRSDDESDGELAAPQLRLAHRAPQQLLRAESHAGEMHSLSGFERAPAGSEEALHCYPPPVLPSGWQPRPPLPPAAALSPSVAPVPAEPPSDEELRRRCDTLAAFVARNGPSFEALARERQRADARFSFLFGGDGAVYYQWRRSQLLPSPPPPPPPQPQWQSTTLTAEERGRLLGEEHADRQGAAHAAATQPPLPPPPPLPLQRGIAASDRAALLESLGRTFTRGAVEAVPPAPPGMSRPGVAEAAPLASTFSSGGFEVAGAPRPPPPLSLPPQADVLAAVAPVQRSVEEWGPEPLLCKRLGVLDPYKGRVRPSDRRTFRTDEFALPGTAQEAADAAPKFLGSAPAPPAPARHQQQPLPPAGFPSAFGSAAAAADEFFATLESMPRSEAPAPAASAASLDKPIDLFKAIFEAEEEEEHGGDGNSDAEEGRPAVPDEATAADFLTQPVLPAPEPQHRLPPLPPLHSALAELAAERRAAKKAAKKDKKERKKEGKRKKEKHKHKHRSRSRSTVSE